MGRGWFQSLGADCLELNTPEDPKRVRKGLKLGSLLGEEAGPHWKQKMGGKSGSRESYHLRHWFRI